MIYDGTQVKDHKKIIHNIFLHITTYQPIQQLSFHSSSKRCKRQQQRYM
jgi:hypothetical protein